MFSYELGAHGKLQVHIIYVKVLFLILWVLGWITHIDDGSNQFKRVSGIEVNVTFGSKKLIKYRHR